MCGLAGTTDPNAKEWVISASASLAHRGPDGDGLWQDRAGGPFALFASSGDVTAATDRAAGKAALNYGPILAHRRLATTDLRAVAAQPMPSRDQRFVLIFNGYIAGHRRLQARLNRYQQQAGNSLAARHMPVAEPALADTGNLAGAPRRTATQVLGAGDDGEISTADTAVLLALLGQALTCCDDDAGSGGVSMTDKAASLARTLAKVRGAYAIALWDRHAQALWLVADGGGQKPLYVAEREDGHIFFASELTPLLSAPGIVHQRDDDAFDQALAHLFIPAPKTAYRTIRQLEPGEIMCWHSGKVARFSALAALPQKASKAPAPLPVADNQRIAAHNNTNTVSALRAGIYRAVADAMACDRPVACLLSGGMDSAGIAALAARVARRRRQKGDVPTAIVMGFPGLPMDETARARQMARHLDIPLKIVAAPSGGEEILLRLKAAIRAFGGPFSNPAVILAHRLAEAVAETAPVCLTGDGGDEIFGGYRRYRMAAYAQQYLGLPGPIRRLAAGGAGGFAQGWPFAMGKAGLHAVAKFLQATAGQEDDVFTTWNNRCVVPGVGQLKAFSPQFVDESANSAARPFALAKRMMQFDQMVTLPGNQLAISDRMGMAAGVEYRPPLLDQAVRTLAAKIPAREHLQDGGKAILRAVVEPFVLERYLRAPKAGFNPPIGIWLCDVWPLLWATQQQAQDRLFSPLAVTKRQQQAIWARAMANEFDAALTVWNLLVWYVWSCEMVADQIN